MNDAVDLFPCCGNCRYSVMTDTKPHGTCNRYAPRPTLGLNASNWTAWPEIHESDWCGEWALSPTDDGAKQ